MKFFWCFCASLCYSLLAHAQVFQFQPGNFLPIHEHGVVLKQAWSGGMLLPVFQQIDLNGDGYEDLVVLDRIDNTISTYLAQREGQEWVYMHAPDYASLFPRVLEFLDLVDYDGDGKKDLFTSANGSVMIYQNVGTVGAPQFVLRNPWTLAHFIAYNYDLNIYVNAAEKPVIADLDGDGDIDILAYELGERGKIRFYKNTSMERFNHRDSLTFETENACWGRFQSFSDSLILLSDSCKLIVGTNREWPEHTQFNLTAIDANKDGLIDLVMGDYGNPHLRYLTNNGRLDSALIQAIQPQWPQYDSVLNIDSYPAAYFVDLNHDGREDMLVAAAQYFNFPSRNQVWMYQNESSTVQDSFRFQTSSFLVDEMLQHQMRSAPYLVDVDGDGAQDLILSFLGTQGVSKVYLYLRKLSLNGNAYFDLVDTSFLGIDTLGLTDVQFTGGDLNGDGKNDLIMGSYNGGLRFYTNIGTANAVGFSPGILLNIPIDTAMAPELVDLNRDGKLDLLIGNYRGNVMYYEHVGTAINPQFQLVSAAFGQIKLGGENAGWAKPRASDFNNNLNYDLVIGSIDGHLHFYPDIENRHGPLLSQNQSFFYPETGIYSNTRLTYYSNPCVTHIDGDLFPDLVVGNERGGLQVYANNALQVSVKPVSQLSKQVVLYPNPTQNGKFEIGWVTSSSQEITSVEIFDLTGRKVPFEWHINASNQCSVTLMQPGLYLASFKTAQNEHFTKRIVFMP